MKKKSATARIEPYTHPAAGWGALKAVTINLIKEKVAGGNYRTLLRQNQPDGFDCPGCAWPDRQHASTFEFCENGVKAVAAEATSKRVTPDFFAAHTVTELLEQSDFELEQHGRLTDPMVYDAQTDRYVPIAWDDAFALIARHLRALPDPNQAAFYTSGRASNEAAFLYQLLVRLYGTNNFPDCSNMCHEATSRGLPTSVGVGKGTVTLDDFEHADTLLIFGQNPATNHPRMMGELRECAKRGATIVSINPLKERGLERFADPQSPIEMLTMSGTKIASTFIQPTIGGDFALIKGMAKRVLELDDAARAAGAPRVLDTAFIGEHTAGFDAFADDLRNESWSALTAESGVPYEQIDSLAQLYARSERVIATWGMGITQHKHSVATVQMLTNLMLMRGNIGRPGAGLCPVRGHSNVQGNRTVGITEKPSAEFLKKIEDVCGFTPPAHHGHDAVQAMQAMIDGTAKALLCLGGNFAVALPDPEQSFPAMAKLDLSVHLGTKLNRSHLLVAKETFVLPVLGRTELDMQATGRQSITVEDSMSMVHASAGKLKPASDQLRSEPAIVAGIAHATLPASKVAWLDLIDDYDRIRDLIDKTVSGFEAFNERIRTPGGFRLPLPPTERVWPTPTGKAMFSVYKGVKEDADVLGAEQVLRLITLRSHDQYNTTIYGLDDRYRGVFGRRDVLFMNPADLAKYGLEHGDLVDIETVTASGRALRLEKITAIEYDIAPGSVGAYYPEANVLVPLDYIDKESGTPSYKSVPVRVARSAVV